jgi:hypothetical protein
MLGIGTHEAWHRSRHTFDIVLGDAEQVSLLDLLSDTTPAGLKPAKISYHLEDFPILPGDNVAVSERHIGLGRCEVVPQFGETPVDVRLCGRDGGDEQEGDDTKCSHTISPLVMRQSPANASWRCLILSMTSGPTFSQSTTARWPCSRDAPSGKRRGQPSAASSM